MIYVVGSGPAGVSCAHALLAKGCEVTMVDAGLDIEPENATLVRRLGSLRPEEWSAGDLAQLRADRAPTSRQGIPLKKTYGSFFPYRAAGDVPLVEEVEDVGAVPSYARGGFSNVWGAGVLPYAKEELSDWSISPADLAPHFEAVVEIMPLAAEHDGLAASFPLYSKHLEALDLSRQATTLLRDLERHGAELEERGFTFGRSRLAVRSRPAAGDPGCVYCGLCLDGCPYRLIYNTASTLESLAVNPRFHYLPGILVDRVRESDATVTIDGRSLAGEPCSFSGARVYLACGALSTARVVLESMGAYDTPLRLQDSQYFLMPLLRYSGESKVTSEDLHALCQIYLRLRRPELGDHDVHLSIYTYNHLYERAVEQMLGPASALLRPLMRPLLDRLLAVQGHLHSSVSSTITATLVEGRLGAPSILQLSVEDTDRPRRLLRRLGRELFRDRHLLRAVPVPALMRVGKAGAGFYPGGSLPMRRSPSRFESDLLGRPFGFQRLHVVDASTFPSIAGTPITLTVMANAHRIASAIDEL